MIPADDRGFTLGDGLFETLLVCDGVFADWDAHLARMRRGCKALGLPAPEDAFVAAAAKEAIAAADLMKGRAALRISWSAGSGGRGLDRPAAPSPRLVVTASPAPAREGPVRLITAQVRRNETSVSAHHKTLAYLDNVMARREAMLAAADEAVMLNSKGEVACAAAANLFWMIGETLFTPALSCGVLPGVVRGKVIDALRLEGRAVFEVASPAADLASADAIVLTNSLIGVRDVISLDGRAMPQVQVGHWIAEALRGR